MEHLCDLQVAVKDYFPSTVGFQWLSNLFMFSLIEQGLLTKYKKLIFHKDTSLKDTYTNIPLINLWAGLKEEFPYISIVAT
jgi:hypothetical protein